MTKDEARVITAAREIRDYLMGVVLPNWPVPPGNLERLDIALDDLDGVPMEKRVPLDKLEEYRENILGQKKQKAPHTVDYYLGLEEH